MNKDLPKYMISVASDILGLHPQTLRQYERLGLVIPTRINGKNRLYSENDMERLEFIINLTKHHGVNLAGVEIIIKMQEQISMLNEKINQIETNIKVKYGESISITPQLQRNIQTIKIEKE